MSIVEKYLYGWQRRTATPTFVPGETYRVAVTGYDDVEGAAEARVGDSVLYIEDGTPEAVGTVAEVRVSEFDETDWTGRAEVLDVVGETTY